MKLARTLRRTFKDRMKDRLPDFKPVADQEDPSGGLLFAHSVSDQLICYLILEVNRRKDWFAVSAAWTPADGQIRLSTAEPDPSESRWVGRLRGPRRQPRSFADDWFVLHPAEVPPK